jgi:hypothetical protein
MKMLREKITTATHTTLARTSQRPCKRVSFALRELLLMVVSDNEG